MSACLRWVLPLVMIFCPVKIYGVDSNCTADTIPLGGVGRVSCHFSEDLSKVPQTLLGVYLYRENPGFDLESTLVASYSWVNGQPKIYTDHGYDLNSSLTDRLEIVIKNARRKQAGKYKCLVALSNGTNEMCTLNIEKGVDSFCISDAIPLGGLGRVSCHFYEDLSKAPQKDLNVSIYRVNDSGLHRVVFYSWVNGQPSIVKEPGYDLNSSLTDNLEILIYNARREHAGDYKCVANSNVSQSKPCTLIINKVTGADMIIKSRTLGVALRFTFGIVVVHVVPTFWTHSLSRDNVSSVHLPPELDYASCPQLSENYNYIVPIVLGSLVLLATIIFIIIFRLVPKWWNKFLRPIASASENANDNAEREHLQNEPVV